MILVALQTVEVQCDTLPTVVHQNSYCSEVCPSETKQQASLDELKGRIQVTLMHISPAIHFQVPLRISYVEQEIGDFSSI